MKELEDKYLQSENKGKLPKRVSWEALEENISSYSHTYENNTYNNNHKKSLSYANLTPHYDSSSISSAKEKEDNLRPNCDEFGSVSLSKKVNS